MKKILIIALIAIFTSCDKTDVQPTTKKVVIIEVEAVYKNGEVKSLGKTKN